MRKKSEKISDERLNSVSGGMNGHLVTHAVTSLVGRIFASHNTGAGQNSGQPAEKPQGK